MARADNDQGKADMMPPSKPMAHSTLHADKYDIPEAGKKVKNVAEASAGTTTPAHKVTGDIKNDALSNPGRFARNNIGSIDSEEHEMAELHELKDKQLGSNAGMSAGYDPIYRDKTTIAPRRGFKNNK